LSSISNRRRAAILGSQEELARRSNLAISRWPTAAAVGQRPVRPRRRLLGAQQIFAGLAPMPLFEEEIAVKVVRVHVFGSDLQRALQQFLRLVPVPETHRPAGGLVVERAQAGVGRTIERRRVQRQGTFQVGPRRLGCGQGVEAAFGVRHGGVDDARPDPGLGAVRVGCGEPLGLQGQGLQRGEPGLAAQLVVGHRPALLEILDGGLQIALGEGRGGEPQAQAEQQNGQDFHAGLPPAATPVGSVPDSGFQESAGDLRGG
jgi:hypothetical protein